MHNNCKGIVTNVVLLIFYSNNYMCYRKKMTLLLALLIL